MASKKLLIRIVILMFIMFALFLVERKFHWYYSIWWFDMPMHFLGGLWVGMFFIYAYRLKDLRPSSISKVLISLIIIGILWEIFEFYVFDGIGRDSFDKLDTISDIFFDLSGGFLALWYFFKNIMRASESAVQLEQ